MAGEGVKGSVLTIEVSAATIKGTVSPQAHACVDEKHFEIIGQTFSNTVGEFRKVFSSV